MQIALFFKRKIPIFLILFFPFSVLRSDNSEIDYTSTFMQFQDRMKHVNQDDPETRRLLERFKPRVFIAPNGYLPINFYTDYLPRCTLRTRGKKPKKTDEAPDRDTLIRVHHDKKWYLDFLPGIREALELDETTVTPTIYGRIYEDPLTVEGRLTGLLFLKYNLVFPYSGLPKKNSWWKKIGARVLGNPRGWHELDIHGAIHIVLEKSTHRPVGVIFAQHNHHRVFLAGKDMTWPIDNRIQVSMAESSNEPYLIDKDSPPRYERAIGDPLHIAYLFGRNVRTPLDAGFDYVATPSAGAREIPLSLELLALDDPLYTATISLGDRKKLMGLFHSWTTTGPPGIDFYTLPELKNMADLMAFWYIDPADETFFKLVRTHLHSFADYDVAPLLAHQKKKLAAALSEIITNIKK